MIRCATMLAVLLLYGCATHSEFVDETGTGKDRADCLAASTQFHPSEDDGGLRVIRPECGRHEDE